jgi:hypothetical protein
MPTLLQHLFSPQVYFATDRKQFLLKIQKTFLTLYCKTGQGISSLLNLLFYLFYIHCFPNLQAQANAFSDSQTVMADSNTNLSPTQK